MLYLSMNGKVKVCRELYMHDCDLRRNFGVWSVAVELTHRSTQYTFLHIMRTVPFRVYNYLTQCGACCMCQPSLSTCQSRIDQWNLRTADSWLYIFYRPTTPQVSSPSPDSDLSWSVIAVCQLISIQMRYVMYNGQCLDTLLDIGVVCVFKGES